MTVIYLADGSSKRIRVRRTMQEVYDLAQALANERHTSVGRIKYDSALTVLDKGFVDQCNYLYGIETECNYEGCLAGCKFYHSKPHPFCSVVRDRDELAEQWYIDSTATMSHLRWHGIAPLQDGMLDA